MSDSYGFEDDLLDRLSGEGEYREKKRRKSSAHLRIVFDGQIPILPDASCKSYPEPLWDLDIDKESRRTRAERHFNAKAICRGCPAQAECFNWAATRQATDDDVRGVWGGKVFAPDTVSYPRCEICDIALALSQNPRRKPQIGFASRTTCEENPNLCVPCAEVVGYVEIVTQTADPEPPQTTLTS